MSALAIIPTESEFRTLTSYAQTLVQSGFLPKDIDTAQKAIAIITYGSELGIGPWQSLIGINVIQGKPTASPQLMLALINRCGELEDMSIEGDEKACTVTMKRKGRSVHTETFTMQDAAKMTTTKWENGQKKVIPLNQNYNWRAMPAVMLKWRAVGACARVAFPDVIMGLYLTEEIDPTLTVDEGGELVGDIIITRDDKPAQKQPTVQHVVDGSTARVVEADADEDEQPEPVKVKPYSDPASMTVYAAGIEVKDTANGKMLSFEIDRELSGKQKRPTTFTRELFKAGGHCNGDQWTATGYTEVFAVPIPIAIKQNDAGFWNVIAVADSDGNWHDDLKPTDPEPPKREPKDVLGQGGNKGPVGRDNGEADDVPDDLPPTGMRPTAFRPETIDPARPKFVDSNGMKLVKRGSGSAVVFLHDKDDKQEISIAASKFEGLVSETEHAQGYANTLRMMKPDGEPYRFETGDLPGLLIELKDGEIVKAFESGQVPF